MFINSNICATFTGFTLLTVFLVGVLSKNLLCWSGLLILSSLVLCVRLGTDLGDVLLCCMSLTLSIITMHNAVTNTGVSSGNGVRRSVVVSGRETS